MSRCEALVAWLAVHALLAAGWWLAREPAWWVPRSGDVLLVGVSCAGLLGALTALIARRDDVRPPLPPAALAAASSLPRAVLRAVVRGAAAGAGLALAEAIVRLWRGALASPPALVPTLGGLVACMVTAAALIEHVLLVTTRSATVAGALAVLLVPLGASAGLFVSLVQLDWNWGGGWAGASMPTAIEWRGFAEVAGAVGLPVGSILAVLAVCRLRSVDPWRSAVVLATTAPVILRLIRSAMSHDWQIGPLFELTSVLLTLPLAVRVGDAVGPGWARRP